MELYPEEQPPFSVTDLDTGKPVAVGRPAAAAPASVHFKSTDDVYPDETDVYDEYDPEDKVVDD